MSNRILVLNSGSSSIKFAVFDATASASVQLQGAITELGGIAAFSARDSADHAFTGQLPPLAATHESALAWLLNWLRDHQGGQLIGAGHRVVHGGEHFAEPALINATIFAQLESLVPLAPLHQPHNLAAIRALTMLQAALPQVACFDTAFHRTQDALAQTFALPLEVTASGIRRYGFHGLSYEYIASVLPQYLGARADGRVIVAHLGNGASLCALRDRKSVATTMGFTALDGLMMGTRSGSIDPGVLFYLMREKAMSPEQLEDLLYRRSGLLGVSGLSGDCATHRARYREHSEPRWLTEVKCNGRHFKWVLKRNIVVHFVKAAALLRWRTLFACCRWGAAACAGRNRFARHIFRAAAATQQLHAVTNDFGAIAILAFFVLPFARADTPLDINWRTLFQILTGDFRLPPEKCDAMPFRVLLLGAALVLEHFRGGNAEIGNRIAAWQIARLRIFSKVADKDHFVD